MNSPDSASRSALFLWYIAIVFIATTAGYAAMHRWDPEGIVFGFAAYATGIGSIDIGLGIAKGEGLRIRISRAWPILLAAALLAGSGLVAIAVRG